MKIIYIGSSGSLSLHPLQALINSKHEICAIAFDDDVNSNFNVTIPNTIQSLALNNSIPLIRFNKNYTKVHPQLESFQADVILVSCYARKLPQSILSIATRGCFNIHPSLLPAYRGPTPLFWQFREGVSEFGITVHRMDEKFDTGNIISQQKIVIQDAVSIKQATDFLANVASDLILHTLDDIENNNIVEIPQNNLTISYQSFPEIDDYTVSTSWTAKRIYNFINAYKGIDVAFLCEINGKVFKLITAYSYQQSSYKNMNGNTILLEGDKITFACQDSYVQCQVKTDEYQSI